MLQRRPPKRKNKHILSQYLNPTPENLPGQNSNTNYLQKNSSLKNLESKFFTNPSLPPAATFPSNANLEKAIQADLNRNITPLDYHESVPISAGNSTKFNIDLSHVSSSHFEDSNDKDLSSDRNILQPTTPIETETLDPTNSMADLKTPFPSENLTRPVASKNSQQKIFQNEHLNKIPNVPNLPAKNKNFIEKFSENWFEELIQPKPTGPDPFPLRQPIQQPRGGVSFEENFVSPASQVKIEENFDQEMEDFFQQSEKVVMKMEENRRVYYGERNMGEKMILSKANYNKMTKLMVEVFWLAWKILTLKVS